jgi:ribonuclease PH
MRFDGRRFDDLRRIEFEVGFTRWAEGSVLTRFGETHVLCNATVEERLPGWLRAQNQPHGWVTAEYALLPRSTQQRVRREQRWPKGRTQEIARLIGRSLRMAVDLQRLGQRQIIVDCDVLQADGGTRTAAITGGWLAAALALRSINAAHKALERQIAAISVGVVDGEPLLDLAYTEDVAAAVDLNVVMTAQGELVEIQGTAESEPFSREMLRELVDLAAGGIATLIEQQQKVLEAAG